MLCKLLSSPKVYNYIMAMKMRTRIMPTKCQILKSGANLSKAVLQFELKFYQLTSSGTGPKLFTLKMENINAGTLLVVASQVHRRSCCTLSNSHLSSVPHWHVIFWILIGPRCPWGPIYGFSPSGRLELITILSPSNHHHIISNIVPSYHHPVNNLSSSL